MARFRSDDHAQKLERAAKAMGLSVDREGSRLSGSKYLHVSDPRDENRAPVKIRISDHALPPSYKVKHGEADLELGTHADAAGGWAKGVRHLSKTFGRDLAGSAKSAVTRLEKDEAAARAAAAAERERAARQQAQRAAHKPVAVEHEIVRPLNFGQPGSRNNPIWPAGYTPPPPGMAGKMPGTWKKE